MRPIASVSDVSLTCASFHATSNYFRELADEIATFHERFKTLRTLRRLLIPGFLSAEFLAGRRQPDLSPFKVYVLCAALFFLVGAQGGIHARIVDRGRWIGNPEPTGFRTGGRARSRRAALQCTLRRPG